MDSKKFDDVFMGVLQHCEQVETFLDTMFSFLSRRTDFFRVMHSRDDKMGFPPGVAENIVLKVFKRYQEIPYRNETSKRTGKPEARADLPSTLNSTSLASDDCATPSPSETETQPAEAAIEIESSHPHGIQSGPTCSAVAADSHLRGRRIGETATPHGSRKTTAHSTSPWAAMMERKCANWLACSFSTDCPANTGKKVSDFTGTTGSQFLRTSQDHKQNESGKTSLDTSRTTDSRLLYRPT
ncbi:nudC domain-containing protein 3-like isoform X1 [Montipora capricornis]|uniref:nudC domain-containing protein 3-like isoform X1 n=1 Tax=Montipora capricornis TaxID=246305 RepID=UPI0035F1D18A